MQSPCYTASIMLQLYTSASLYHIMDFCVLPTFLQAIFVSVSHTSSTTTNCFIVSYDTKQRPLIQYALMLGYYTSSFRIAKPELAADYLILIASNADLPGEAGKQQAVLCLEGLRELVLETREFATLLGDIRNDGQRVPGAVQRRGELLKKAISAVDGQARDVASYMKLLTVQAATSADEYGRTTDAVLLYHLAGEYDRVLHVTNRTLADALTVELGREPTRLEPLKPRSTDVNGSDNGSTVQPPTTLSLTAVDDPVVLTQNMFNLYISHSGESGPTVGTPYADVKIRTRETTRSLLTLAHAKAALLSGQYTVCLDQLASTGIFPLGANGDVATIRKCANKFGQLPAVVTKCVGDALVWAVRACHGERKRLTSGGWGQVDGREQQIQLLKMALDDLGVFAGLVRYKLRQGVFEALAATEASWGS
jgi:nuclear pore complex protein Nup93